MNNTGKVLLGVLTGIVAGGLLGVLFAPEKGSDTRKKISKKSGDYADALKGKFNDFLDSITEKFEKVKEEVTDFAEHTEAKMKKSPNDGKTITV
jgi:gas vesicle protein